MKILIVENIWMGDGKYGFFDKTLLNAFSILPTLYARKIAAITPKKHAVTIVNERYAKIDFSEPYDIVNINFTTSTAFRAYEIAEKFREKGVAVVLSGLHASALPQEAKKHADSVLLGWGEVNWLQLLEDFEKNRLKPVYEPGKYDGSVRIPATNVDLPGFVVSGATEATRGCPYKCDFCPEASIPGGRQFFARPVEDVVAEIRALPQKTFTFYDLSLTINTSYTKSLFRKMRGLHKRFSCNGNVDVLASDMELVRLSREAGCVSWLVGFESVSQQTLNEVGKGTNKVEEYAQAVKNIHDNGMVVIGSFMFGFDTDTKDVFYETLKMIKELEIDIVDFCILTPFPGTPVFNRLEKEGRILTKDWSKYKLNVVFLPKNMTPDELLNGVRKIYRDFYSTFYTIKRVVKSIRLGFYPFILVLERNFAASMSHRRLFLSK
jgi:radical SAM superfamily enzyme YgiQ (UPF0313 family)